jgi:hypothetical protein
MRNLSIDKDKKKSMKIVSSLEENLKNQNNSTKILVTNTMDANKSRDNFGED